MTQLSSVQFCSSVVSNSLQPHEFQHARPLCPSPNPRVHPNSRPSSQWCHPDILYSVVPFSSCPQSLPASESSSESTLYMRWPKCWSFSFSITPSKKIMINPDSILKSRDITWPTEVHLVRAMVSPVVMYGCESWAVKRTECWRIDAFELWCWRSLLRVPWTARRSNQSILKKISPGISLELMMLKLKLQYFGHLM